MRAATGVRIWKAINNSRASDIFESRMLDNIALGKLAESCEQLVDLWNAGPLRFPLAPLRERLSRVEAADPDGDALADERRADGAP